MRVSDFLMKIYKKYIGNSNDTGNKQASSIIKAQYNKVLLYNISTDHKSLTIRLKYMTLVQGYPSSIFNIKFCSKFYDESPS